MLWTRHTRLLLDDPDASFNEFAPFEEVETPLAGASCLRARSFSSCLVRNVIWCSSPMIFAAWSLAVCWYRKAKNSSLVGSSPSVSRWRSMMAPGKMPPWECGTSSRPRWHVATFSATIEHWITYNEYRIYGPLSCW